MVFSTQEARNLTMKAKLLFKSKLILVIVEDMEGLDNKTPKNEKKAPLVT